MCSISLLPAQVGDPLPPREGDRPLSNQQAAEKLAALGLPAGPGLPARPIVGVPLPSAMGGGGPAGRGSSQAVGSGRAGANGASQSQQQQQQQAGGMQSQSVAPAAFMPFAMSAYAIPTLDSRSKVRGWEEPGGEEESRSET